MHIGNYSNSNNFNNINSQPVNKNVIQSSITLKSPMIERIWNVKPGCSSCGK